MPESQNELLVKSRAITVSVPLSLKTMREYYLPRYRRSEHFASLSSAESTILMDSMTYLRTVLKKLPRMDWLYEHFSERGAQNRDAALSIYSEKIFRLLAPSRWDLPVRKLTLHLYESVTSALNELRYAYSVPVSFLYSLALTHAISQFSFVLPADKPVLEKLRTMFENRVEEVTAWAARVDTLVGIPDYLRVAAFLEKGKVYTAQSIGVIAMSVAVIHSGLSVSERRRKIMQIIESLINHGFLQDLTNRSGMYLCVKEFSEEYGGNA